MISYGKCTKAQYEALTPVQDRIYYITDTGEQFLNGLPYNGEDNKDYLCLTAETDGATVGLKYDATPSAYPVVWHSADRRTWTAFEWTGNATDVATLANAGDKVYLRAFEGGFGNTAAESTNLKFSMTGTIAASGNVMSLLHGDDFETRSEVPTFGFQNLFRGCASLVEPPEMPATRLGVRAYYCMYYGCALRHCPALPARTLTQACYGSMFGGGHQQFDKAEIGADSFEADPDFPLSEMAPLNKMFKGCASLATVTAHFELWSTTDIGTVATNWLQNTATTGVFKCPSALDTTTRDASHVPAGWSVIYTDIEASKSVPTPQSYSVLGWTRPVQTEAKQLRWSYSFDPGACLWLEAIDSPVTVGAFLSATASETQTVDLWWSTNGVLWQKNTITARQPLQLDVNLQNHYQDSGNGTFSKRIYLWKDEPNRLTKCLLLSTSASVRVGGNLDSMTSTSTKTAGQTGPAYEFYRLLSGVKVAEFDQLVLPDRPLGDHALSQCFGASGTVGDNDQGIPLSPMIPVRSDHAATAFDSFWYTSAGSIDSGLNVSTVRFFNKSSSQVIVGGSANEGADQYGTPLPAYRNMGPSCMRGIVEMYGPSDTTIDIAHVFNSSAYYATKCVGMGEQKFVRNRGNRTSENLKSYAGYVYKLAVAASSTLTLGLDALTRFNTSSQGYIEAIIDCDATGTVAFGTGFGSNNDAIVQGKRNHCVVRVTQGVGRLFVVDTEDIPNA